MWSWKTDSPLEKLDKPPIVEVICGIHFEPLDLDPVVVGGFWAERHKEFPKRQVHTALTVRPTVPSPIPQFQVHPGAGPLRTWLISEDDALLIQIQHDRFYLNWRARGETSYPRFSGANGLMEQAIGEYQRFGSFCEKVLGKVPSATRIELGKVDQLTEGDSWSGFADLAEMVPALAGPLRFAEGKANETSFRLRDEKDGAVLSLLLDSTISFLQKPVRGIKLQTTVEMPTDGSKDVRPLFVDANTVINSIFAELIPEKQRKRFMKKGDA